MPSPKLISMLRSVWNLGRDSERHNSAHETFMPRILRTGSEEILYPLYQLNSRAQALQIADVMPDASGNQQIFNQSRGEFIPKRLKTITNRKVHRAARRWITCCSFLLRRTVSQTKIAYFRIDATCWTLFSSAQRTFQFSKRSSEIVVVCFVGFFKLFDAPETCMFDKKQEMCVD